MLYLEPRLLSDIKDIDINSGDVSFIVLFDNEGEIKELSGDIYDLLVDAFKSFIAFYGGSLDEGEILESLGDYYYFLSISLLDKLPASHFHATIDEHFMANDDGELESIGHTICLYITPLEQLKSVLAA